MSVLLLSNGILRDDASASESVSMERALDTATGVESSQASVVNTKIIGGGNTSTSVAQV